MTKLQWDRRRLLSYSALSLTAPWWVGCQTAASDGTVDEAGLPFPSRSSWTQGVDLETKKKFQMAVAWFKANDKEKFGASDPRSYLTWKKLASVHALSCQHMTWFFLPWHRLYLNYFETACRYALKDSSFVLPYWDWTESPSIPPEFFASAFPELAAKRALHPTGRIPEEFVGQALIDKLMGIDDFYAFHSGPSPSTFSPSHMMAGTLEGSCHNAVHNGIGGDMLKLAAPEDPIFWLHHANIDRLWAMWARRHPQASVPVGSPQKTADRDRINPSEWLDSKLELRFIDPKAPGKSRVLPDIPRTEFNAAARGHANVRDLLTTEGMRYTYSTLKGVPKKANASESDYSKRNEMLIDGISRVENSVLISNLTLNAELIGKLQALSDGRNHASLLALNVPLHPDPIISNRLILRFFIYGETEMTRGYTDQIRSSASLQSPDFLGSYTFLVQGHLTHEQFAKGAIHINLDVTAWFKQAKPFQNLSIAAVAIDPARQNAVIDLFPDVETELKLQFSAS